MADNPNTGRTDKPGFPSSFDDIFFGLVKGAISVFNPPADVKPIDVLRASPAWHDPEALQRARDRLEERSARTLPNLPPKQLRDVTAGRNRLFSQIDDQLEILRAQPRFADVPEFEPSSTTVDQQSSPVFSGPGQIGVGGGVLLGIGAGGTDWNKIIQELGKKGISRSGPRMSDAGVRYARRIRPLPKTNAEKLLIAAGKVLSKLPKWALPDSELVALGKNLGKALKGAKGGVVGIVAQVGGQYALEAGIKIANARQDAASLKILGPQDAKAWAKRQAERKGPTSRTSKKAGKKLEPARPRPPGPPTTANAAPGGRTRQPPRPVRPKVAPLDEVKVTAQRITHAPVGFATPAQMKIVKPVNKLAVIQKYANAIGTVGRLYLATKGPGTQPRMTNSLLPGSRTATSPSYFSQAARTTTGTSSGCYTVCRKKSTGKKKRKAPRVCVTPQQARKAGIIH